MMVTIKKSALATIPCEICKKIDPSIPSAVNVKIPIVTIPMCATEEYAIILLRSVCLKVVILAYITPNTPKVYINGVKYCEALGIIAKLYRINP